MDWLSEKLGVGLVVKKRMAHIREIKFRYVPKFSITKNIRFSNQKKIANNLVKYLKKLKYLKINKKWKTKY